MVLSTINIAIAGRTNVGKTTLIRTLMKTSIGEVGDSPNVTKIGEAYYFNGLQATFIDTPGFQNASVIAMCLDAQDKNPDFRIPQEWQDELVYDQDAINALENSDSIIYVASLSSVPDASFKSEISIIKRKSLKIVAVINQYEKQVRATSVSETRNRVEQWIEFFNKESINHIVVFDAHWDNPSKINQVYDNILDILDPNQKLRFVEGLKRFKERQSEITREACDMLASLIKDCEEKAVITGSKQEFKDTQKLENAKEQVARRINGAMAEFVYCVCDLYKVAAEHPTTSKDELCLLMKARLNVSSRISVGSGGAAILGSMAAFIVGIAGAVTVGLLTGGVGTLAGAMTGAQIGGSIGAAIGSTLMFFDDSDSMTIRANEEQMKIILIKAIAIIWGLSNNGYGRGKELSSEEGKDIEVKVYQTQASYGEINLFNANKPQIITYCQEIIKLLEG